VLDGHRLARRPAEVLDDGVEDAPACALGRLGALALRVSTRGHDHSLDIRLDNVSDEMYAAHFTRQIV